MKKKIINFLDIAFIWGPLIAIEIICAYVLFPWSDLASKQTEIKEVIFSPNAAMFYVLSSYIVVLAKNSFDLNHKIYKKLEVLKQVNADEFFIFRNELEPLEEIFENAEKVSFSGGHLATVIIHCNDSLNNFLKSNKEAKFILPNPMNEFVISQYAAKLMVNTTERDFKENVVSSLRKIKGYQDKGYKIQVKLYNIVPSFGLQIIEGKNRDRMYVELNTLQTEVSKRVLFPVYKSEARQMYRYFEAQFNILWNDSKEIQEIEGLLDLLDN